MAPSFTLDDTMDFIRPATHPSKSTSGPRTLLLAPPSISAHPEALSRIVEAHDRSHTDIQMLDRLAVGLVSLPAVTYDVIVLLADADGTRKESRSFLSREVVSTISNALKSGGRLRSQDGTFGSVDEPQRTEAILAGLVNEGSDGMVKPATETQAVPLRFGKKKTNWEANGTMPLPVNGKRKSISIEPAKPAGVGFVDFSDDLDIQIITGEDDELIDEDDLLTEADLARPIVQRECPRSL